MSEKDFESFEKDIKDNTQSAISKDSILQNGNGAADNDSLNKILFEWNDTSAPYTKDKTVKDLFEEKVKTNPDKTAFIYSDRKLSFSELNKQANRLSSHLQKLGIKPGDIVGLCFERSIEMMVSLLAIIKTGAAYLPLDPSHPEERLSYIIHDSNLRVLITREQYKNIFSKEEIVIVGFHIDDDKFTNENEKNPDIKFNSESPAYVIYTSGSTGKPKGALGTHKGIVNRVFWEWNTFPYSKDEICCQRVSLSFVGAVAEIFTPLLHGVTSVLIPDEIIKDIERLVNFLFEKKITRIIMVPSLLRGILESDIEIKKLSNINLWSCSGEALTKDVCNKFLKLLPESILLNRYGPTETASDATYCKIDKPITSVNVPIGRPLPNVQVYILDESLNPVPVGVSGELYIGGDGLAIGYLNRPELTEERFIENPFDKNKSSRLYKSGDVARYLPDGNIEFLGRTDNQVNIRGFRMELGEIESELMEHPDIKQAVVIATDAELDEKKLMAYIVTSDNEAISIRELRNFLSKKLPEYMLPSAFVFLEKFPLTPNGKINRLALAEFEIKRESDFTKPRNETEEKILKIWKEVLKIDTIGVKDNFFESGGHSLLATQVISRIRKEFKIEISLKSGFESPTVEALAKKVMQLKKEKAATVVSQIEQVQRADKVPLSFAQQRLWFLDRLEPNNPFYNISQSVRIEGKLSIEKFTEAIEKIISRHESLRTNFKTEGDIAYQTILHELKSNLIFIDISNLSAEEQKIRIDELSKKDAGKPFDIEKDILFRTTLIKLNESNHVFLLTIHHIISDEWSLGNFYNELGKIYDELTSDKKSRLNELQIQYADYSQWQRDWLKDDILKEQLSYWKNELSGDLPFLNLPIDKPRPKVQTYSGKNKYFFISKELTGKLNQICKEENVTLFMILLAAFNAFLHRYTGQNDIIIGSPIAGRNRIETEDVIGFFVNTLSLRTDLSSNPKFTELLKKVRSTSLNAYEHQDLPFEKLVEEIQPVRDMSRTPVFQVMLNLLNTPLTVLKFSELIFAPVQLESGTAKFDLTLEIQELSGELKCWFEYNTDLFEDETIERMTKNFLILLTGISENPGMRISEFTLLSDEEKNKILFEWNDTKKHYELNKTINELFEEQVAAAPDKVAVKFSNATLTYNGLNDKSTKFAHYLIKAGVARETIVGVCLERSIEMVIAILGILKAGGAYLPLDPEYPAERLNYMMTDSKAPVLVASENTITKFSNINAKTILIDGDREEISFESNDKPDIKVNSNNAAYIIYTSGSTGNPKGVIGLHKGAVNRFMWSWEIFPFEENEVCCQKTTLSFVDSIWEIFGPLLKGIPTVYIPDSILIDPNLLIKKLAEEKVTRIVLVPSLLKIILDYDSNLQKTLPELKYWVTSGEALSQKLMQDFYKRLPDRVLLNLYGSSEVSADATFYNTKSFDLTKPVSIGNPISNNQIYILDAYSNIVPIGVRGEIHIGGAGLARGYLFRDELTSEKFIENNFNTGEKLFRSGDVGKYFSDGNIEYIGRIDHQVKLRGFRIELDEIKSVINEHHDVKESVVIFMDDKNSDKKIIAFIVTKNSRQLFSNELRQFTGKKLPYYMIPSNFVFIEKLPLTPNGKLDRKVLMNYDTENFETELTSIPARDELDLQLIKIWEEILDINNIGIRDNFFEIGGHSLLAVSIFSQIEKRLEKQLPLAILFQAQTVEKLADVIKESGYISHWSSLVPIQTVGAKPPLFFVHGGGGNILFCYDLAKLLGNDQPFYGLQAVGLDRSVPPYASVKEMATHYIKEMKTIQAEGPYFLGGNCFGGLVTYEIAQQLKRAGDEIALCVLVETYVPDDPNLVRKTIKEKLDDFVDKGFTITIKKNLWAIVYNFFKSINMPLPKSFRSVVRGNQYAYNHYKPEFYDGHLTLFIANHSPYWNFNDETFGWGNYTDKKIDYYKVPGGHLTVFEKKNISGLAESLKESLEKAMARLDATKENN